MTEDMQGFQAPQTITPEGLADDLAVLVWESFTDFISEWEGSSPLADPSLCSAGIESDWHESGLRLWALP